MTNTPSDAEIEALAQQHLKAFVQFSLGEVWFEGEVEFARAVLQRWGQPSGAGEAAEHYRNAIASACEGWTMPDGLRKHLETALWSLPTQAQAGEVPLTDDQIQDLLLCGNPTDEEMRLIRIGWDAANGIKGASHDR